MKLNRSLLCTALLGGAFALAGCVTQPSTSTSASQGSSNAALLASTTGAVLSGVLQANGGAAGLMSSLGVPAAGTASNAAGVLTYCAKHNYLNPDKAGALTNQLLASLGLPTATTPTSTVAAQDAGYLNGIAGMIVAPNGQLFSLEQMRGNVKDKACEFVMSKAQAFL